MPAFRAQIVNLPGYGEDVTKHKSGGFTRDKTLLDLDGIAITIKQRRAVLKFNSNYWRGKQLETSTIFVSKVRSFDQGRDIVDDLCWLLSFAHSSHIQAYSYSFGKRGVRRGALGNYNSWRPPFHSGVGRVSDFVEQAWPKYQQLKSTRPLPAFIHMINASDLPNTNLLETQISSSMQCLESIKSYFALSEGARLGISEATNGSFRRANKEVSFEDLLQLTLQDVGMPLPQSFDTIKKLRNALIHRGFIRQSDNVTKYIFGSGTTAPVHSAMFDVMEDVQDVLREYLLRLLGYKGQWCAYGHRGPLYREIR